MANPADRRYSKEHEWVLPEGDTLTIGITDYAQEQLTDIVFVELPEMGRQVKAGDAVAVLETVKSVADVYAPCDGEVSEINHDDPSGRPLARIKVSMTNQNGDELAAGVAEMLLPTESLPAAEPSDA